MKELRLLPGSSDFQPVFVELQVEAWSLTNPVTQCKFLKQARECYRRCLTYRQIQPLFLEFRGPENYPVMREREIKT